MIVQGRLILDPAQRPEPGWIRLAHERIEEVHLGDLPAGVRADCGNRHAIISPGFVDAHTHLPQFNCIGRDGMPLLDWLQRVVFPAEARWTDAAFAARDAEHSLTRMLKSGTLACAAYLTSHDTSIAAATHANRRIPIRMRAGRVLMDREAPAELCVDEFVASHWVGEESRSTATSFDVSINPRFAIACSEHALGFAASVGGIESGRWMQTHLAENLAECARVRQLFPGDRDYTSVYDRFGLLHARSLLAHAIHLSDEEWELIRERESVVVHCPTANLFLDSGYFDLDAAHEHGVRVALGTDVGAGPDVAMPRVARAMIETAKWRRMTISPHARVPTPMDAWSLITRGNAEALGWHDLGRIEQGAAAFLLVLQPPDRFVDDEFVISRLIYEWDDSYISTAIVNGAVYRMQTL